MSKPTGTQLTIVIHLPQTLDAVAKILDTVGKQWPEAKVDTGHADGWHIVIGPTP